jgi:hypothetical protein
MIRGCEFGDGHQCHVAFFSLPKMAHSLCVPPWPGFQQGYVGDLKKDAAIFRENERRE